MKSAVPGFGRNREMIAEVLARPFVKNDLDRAFPGDFQEKVVVPVRVLLDLSPRRHDLIPYSERTRLR
jgi:hypothetical protein